MGQWNSELLKKFIAPAIDVRPEVQLSDLNAEFVEAEHWFTNYFLNSVFTGEFTGENRPYAESIIMRTQFVFSGYSLARSKTLDYADNWRVGAPGIKRYLAAVGVWEGVFLNLQVIYDLQAKWLGAIITGDHDRTRLIANRIKHVSEDIRDGHLPGPGIPMWLDKNGFVTTGPSLTFEEMEAQVRFLSKIANCLSSPAETKVRIATLLGGSSIVDPNPPTPN